MPGDPRPGGAVPDELLADFSGGFGRERMASMRLVPSTDRWEESVRVWCDSREQIVFVAVAVWWKSLPDGSETIVEQVVDFVPTTIAAEAGVGSAFWVAGFDEGAQQTVVERWSVVDVLVTTGTARVVPGIKPIPHVTFGLRRERCFALDAVGPPTTMAYGVADDRLWILEGRSPHTLWRLDVTTGELEPYANANELPALARMKQAKQWLVEDTHPSNGGLLLVMFDWPSWHRPSCLNPSFPSGRECLVMYDRDVDGLPDFVAALSWEEYAALGYWPHVRTEFAADDV